jgi:hypothetical protein
MSQITVIFDGQCEFCQQSVTWIESKLAITALPFQTSDLSAHNLTREQCAKQVYVISAGRYIWGSGSNSFLTQASWKQDSIRINHSIWSYRPCRLSPDRKP